MYFPYLRGKEFELLALLEVNRNVYSNTIPILEPVKSSDRRKLYEKIANANFPLIIVTNPYYGDLSVNDVQTIIDEKFAVHTSLILGFIVDNRFNIADLRAFLNNNQGRRKALIFRYNPLPADLNLIQAAITTTPVSFVIFDDKKTGAITRAAFSAHSGQVVLTDGFQRQERNSDYPVISSFDSQYGVWRTKGLFGIGDYLTIGDVFQDGRGPVYVVALHVTTVTTSGMLAHHFKSTVFDTTQGLSAPKFAEANGLLVTSPSITPLTSGGLTLYRGWHTNAHNPQLGAAKKASMIHHIELMSRIV